MYTEVIENFIKRKKARSANQIVLNYRNYFNRKNINGCQRIILGYRDVQLELTQNQINVLRLIARGFSNAKIARKLSKKESAIKLLIYRLMRYMETVLYETIDRFHLIIIAQELSLD